MSAVFKRNLDEEGLEMPVKEVVSRVMLCAMFGLSEKEPLHIFNSEGAEETYLFVLEAEFTPKKAGDYIIKLESEVQREQLIANGDVMTLVSKFKQEMIFPVNVIYDPRYEQNESWTRISTKAVLRRLDGKLEFELAEGQVVSKEKICQFFSLDEDCRYTIITPSGTVIKEFSKSISMEDKRNFFAAEFPGVYHFLADEELECSELETVKKLLLDEENRVTIMELAKISPLYLNVVTNPWELDNFGLVVSRENPLIKHRKVEIHSDQLKDLQSFDLQGLVFQGDIEKCEREESLLKGCRAVQLHNIAYKTFISHFNPMSIVAEMLKVLKPKRAEIWLCRVENSHNLPNVTKSFEDELTGKEWPFEKVTEELKLVTASASYLEEMQRSGLTFSFLSRVKVFEAIIVREFAAPVIQKLLMDFQRGGGKGKLEMAQFIFPRCEGNVLDGLRLSFEEEIDESHRIRYPSISSFDNVLTHGLLLSFKDELKKMEGRSRIRAGVPSENGDELAIVEIRSGIAYNVVTVAFTYDYLFTANRRRLFNKIEEFYRTVNPIFN